MNSLQGQLLIAAPQFVGAPLPRAVVLITEHSAAGAQGVVLNHPLNEQLLRTCFDLWQQGKSPKMALEMIQFSAAPPAALEHSSPANETAAEKTVVEKPTATPELLPPEAPTQGPDSISLPQAGLVDETDANGNLPAVPAPQLPVGLLMAPATTGRLANHLPPAFRVVVGQVGWPQEQLSHDLNAGLWLTTPATPDLIFGLHDDLWQTAVKRVGEMVLVEALGLPPHPAVGLN